VDALSVFSQAQIEAIDQLAAQQIAASQDAIAYKAAKTAQDEVKRDMTAFALIGGAAFLWLLLQRRR
jgi:hypothetical protein